MMMRFRSGGIRHKSTREATRVFQDDLDKLDKMRNDFRNCTVVTDDSEDSESEMDLGKSGSDEYSDDKKMTVSLQMIRT
jgi:hypothetical protein